MAGSIGLTTVGWLPWMGVKTSTTTVVRTNASDHLGMGRMNIANGLVNNQWSVDVYMDVGTWKLAWVHLDDPSAGIATFALDGVSIGTVDAYAGAQANNQYDEITGISVTTAGVKNLTVTGATKNASASDYYTYTQSIALIRTAGTGSTPAGTDTPGTTWIYLPFMGSKANTSFASRTQDSTLLGGGSLSNTSGINDEVSWDIWLEAGTYKFALIYEKNADVGIHHVRLDGSDVGTIDGYNGSRTVNNYSEVTAIAVAAAGVKTFAIKMASKNASASNYVGRIQSVSWIKTA